MKSTIKTLLEKEQHLVQMDLGQKMLSIVDHHQYVLLIWAEMAQALKKPLTLVSIDFHPDTNPPFWLQAYQKAMAIDPDREAQLVETFISRVMDEIDADDLETLTAKMSLMRNDEHIRTGMALGYLKDYHMINCMEKHCYDQGTHYLVPEDSFGSLKNEALTAAGFSVSTFLEKLEGPLVLDVDLDYFMHRSDFEVDREAMSDFIRLAERAEGVTSARSATYFEHLRREDFSMESCEAAFIALMKQLLQRA